MKDILLIIVIVIFFLLGLLIMKKIDIFINKNKRSGL